MGMDGAEVKGWEARCIEEQPPACQTACPLKLDVRTMLDKTKAGAFAAAFDVYQRAIPFPAITSHICDAPCGGGCRRAEAGGAIRIRAIERAIVEEAYATLRRRAQPARKPKKVAVIGAGLAGCTTAFDLALKGHLVTILEAGDRALDRLHLDYADVLPASAILSDIGQLDALGVVWRFRARVTADGLEALIAESDAVIIAPGRGPARQFAPTLALDGAGRLAVDVASCATSHPKVFAAPVHDIPHDIPGLPPVEYSPIGSMHEGRRAAVSVDRFLQGASLTANRQDDGGESCLYVNVAAHEPVAPVVPAERGGGYTRDEAMAEAARCFPCHCLECVKACEFLKRYGAYPKRYVREIYNNDSIVMGNRKANRMIDSCTLCGLCAELCPNDLAMADVVLAARRSMVARGKMPVSHHDVALADMDAARAAGLARHQPSHGTSAYAFFPGCQLAGSSPDHVVATYRHLTERLTGGVGLLLDCCGAPARWSGREALFGEIGADLGRSWEALGRPNVITACSTCLTLLPQAVPEMAVTSLWSVLAEIGLPEGARAPAGPLALHDPCTARHAPDVQAAVRGLAGLIGADIREIDGAAKTTCCGFGGLALFANRDVADAIVTRRASDAPSDYLAYCAMCRDQFARVGKRATHLLDLVFPAEGDAAARPDPGLSGRRTNRALLKRRVLREIWEEDVSEPEAGPRLSFADGVSADMERRLILVEDVARTIAAAEAGGPKLIDRGRGVTIASHRHGALTCWVEYRASGDGFSVGRVYGHRMDVEAKR